MTRNPALLSRDDLSSLWAKVSAPLSSTVTSLTAYFGGRLPVSIGIAGDGALEVRLRWRLRIRSTESIELVSDKHVVRTSGMGPVPGKPGLRYSVIDNTALDADGDPVLSYRVNGSEHVPYRLRERTLQLLAKKRGQRNCRRHCVCGCH